MSSNRKRVSLFAGSAAVAAWLLAGTAIVAVTPTAALADFECGDPTANGTSSDSFVCTGEYESITYPLTSGTLTLTFRPDVLVHEGISITPSGSNTFQTSVQAASGTPDTDPTIRNSDGAAFSVVRSTGGTININLPDFWDTGAGVEVSGTTAGFFLRNAGTGQTTVSTQSGIVTASSGAGVDIGTTGTGNITVNNGNTSGSNLRDVTITGSTAAIRVASGQHVTVTNNLSGTILGLLDFANTGNITITNRNVVDGGMSFSNGGNTTINNTGEWYHRGDSVLHSATTAGATTVTNGARMFTNLDGGAEEIDFGLGVGVFNNSGLLSVGAGAEGPTTLTLRNVDTWNNSGSVRFGADLVDLSATDGEANDRVVVANASGGVFNASGNSRLVMDVDFGASQADCAAAVTADCLDLRGFSTAGQTEVIINPVAFGSQAERIVIVDVSGAGSDEGSFVLSSLSAQYRDIPGGAVKGGILMYGIRHDAAAQQHVLTAVAPDGDAMEMAVFSRAATAVWHTATGSWFDRQADLRTSLLGRSSGMMPGGWLRVSGNYIDETRYPLLAIEGAELEFNHGFKQDTVALVGGIDLINVVDSDSAWVTGVTFGSLESDLGFKVTPTELSMEGHSLGLYASWATPRFFLDAIMNTTVLDVGYSSSPLGVEDLRTTAESTGYQIEGGYRIPVNDSGAYFEPLVTVTRVTTTFDDLALGNTVVTFDDAVSLRGALGLRLGGDVEMGALTAGFSFIGRLWNEFEGENTTHIPVGPDEFSFLDEHTDVLSEVGVAVSLFGLDNRLSARLGYGVEFMDDYQNTDVTFGVRYTW